MNQPERDAVVKVLRAACAAAELRDLAQQMESGTSLVHAQDTLEMAKSYVRMIQEHQGK